MEKKKKNNKTKVALLIGNIATFFLILILPIIIFISIIVAPILVINDIFKNVGNWFNSNNDEITELFNDFVESEDGQDMLHKYYIPMVRNEKRVEIPINWLVVPNVLAGIESPSEEQLQKMIDILVLSKNVKEGEETKTEYKLNTLQNYLEELRKLEPYNIEYEGKTTVTIKKYVENINVFEYFQPLSEEYLASIGADEFIYPFSKKGIVTDVYGYREPVETSKGTTGSFHHGTDIVFPYPNNCGVPIYSISDGTVLRAGFEKNGAGYFVNIQKDNFIVKYFHLQTTSPFKTGDVVNRGDFIGVIGSTGISTGCHLHLETWVDNQSVDSFNFIDYENPRLPE